MRKYVTKIKNVEKKHWFYIQFNYYDGHPILTMGHPILTMVPCSFLAFPLLFSGLPPSIRGASSEQILVGGSPAPNSEKKNHGRTGFGAGLETK